MARKRSRDPWWLRIIDLGYALLLFLFPPAFRREYAECMRQVLRDRCRDARQRKVSLLRLLLIELPADLIGSLWEEHTMSFAGSSHRRVLGWVGALAFVAMAISQAGLLSDWLYRHYSPRAVAWKQGEEAKAWQYKSIDGFLVYLEAQRTPRAMALRLALEPEKEPLWQPGEFASQSSAGAARMQEEVSQLLRQPLDETAFAALASSCRSSGVCEDRDLASHLRSGQSDNGYSWLWVFEAARISKDDAAMQFALRRMADAPRFVAPKSLLMQELLRQRRAYGGDDARLDAALFDRSLAFAGAPLHGVVDSCRRTAGLPASLDSCRRISERLLNSGDLRESVAGARLAYALATTESERDVARERYRQVAWLADHYPRRLWDSPEWHQDHGGQWLAAWQHAGSEVDALVAWQEAMGIGPFPPRGYQMTPARRRVLVAAGR